MIVIADTAPLLYLVLIDQADLLRAFYQQVFIPEAVVLELSARGAPPKLSQWLAGPPAWLAIRQVPSEHLAAISADLDEGEREAIALARGINADLVLMDDQAGRAEARRWHLRVTGTLGILRVAAERGMIEVGLVLDRLRATSFYLDEGLVQAVFREWLDR